MDNSLNGDDSRAGTFQAVIFDLDGTLLDTLADIGDSVNQMLAEYGFSGHTIDDYRHFIGNGIQMLVTRALPMAGRTDEMILACVRRAREIYWENWNRKTRPYDGIMNLLERLETMGVPKAVLSNKPNDFTVRYVKAYFPEISFFTVMGQNDHYPVKPDPASALEIARRAGLPPNAFLFVGDSTVDVKTATASGMHPVGVSWGFKGPAELVNIGCRTLVQHPSEIIELFENP